MVCSMTGFASITRSAKIGGEQTDIMVTLKAFNGRFFEAHCKMSHNLSALEVDVTRRLKVALTRGTIQCQMYARSSGAALGARIAPAWQTIESYVAAEEAIAQRYGLQKTLTTSAIISLPNAFETLETFLTPEEHQEIMGIVTEAIAILEADRNREGAAVGRDITERITRISELFKTIPPRAEQIVTERRIELTAQLEKLLHTASQETRDQQRVALDQQLDRLDIHEEIARFGTHLINLQAILTDKQQEKGKRIEFTLQELLREVNTMASKCPDSELTTSAIRIKVELEKAREQSQNII